MMYLELFGGLIYLLLAGDLLVRGSVALAKRAEIPAFLVGLTIVAFGTSAPELFVSMGAAFQGQSGIAVGNVVGSNIANVLLVLGVPALISTTLCDQESLGRDTVCVLLGTVLFVLFCFLGPLGRPQGAILFGLLLCLLWRSVRAARRGEGREPTEEELERGLGLPTSRRMIALFIALGLLGLPVGADLLVEGAVELATLLGVSSAVVGVSIVAIGTSLPELATTVVAALQRHSDIALGNVLGSNLFNVLAIMGLTALVAPAPIPIPPEFLRFDLLVMLAVTLALGWFAWRRSALGRTWGLAMLAAYALYLGVVFQLPVDGAIGLAGH